MSELDAIKEDVCRYARQMYTEGMVVGTAGNVSARLPDGESGADGNGRELRVAITPSSLPYEDMTPGDIVVIDGSGNTVGEGRPASFEKTLHLAVYKARPDVGAILHTHAVYCSVLAVLRRPLPPVIEELVPYVGGQVDVAEFAMSGSDELAANVVAALGGKAAAILANHGNLCCGKTLAKAMKVARLVERCARVYVTALDVGDPKPLEPEVLERELSFYEVLKDFG
jgi:L-fuculose-phosphate aldolase